MTRPVGSASTRAPRPPWRWRRPWRRLWRSEWLWPSEWRWRRDDEGQVLLLTLVYVVVAFSLVVVVIDATAVHLARTQLRDAADAAALDAADSIEVAGTYGAADGSSHLDLDPARRLVLTDASVREQAEAYLGTYEPPTRVDAVTIGPGTGSADGQSATVVLSGRVRLPMAGSVIQAWSEGVVVTVRSTAIAPVRSASP